MLVVDASVIVKLAAPEPDTEAAERVFRHPELHAPSQARLEVANALRRRAASIEIARTFVATLPARLVLHPDDRLFDAAFDLAVELDHEIYDCLYLALAVALDCRLVTADRAFAAKASKRRRGRAVALADWR
jgi:predicted nucleic acid-binding protein